MSAVTVDELVESLLELKRRNALDGRETVVVSLSDEALVANIEDFKIDGFHVNLLLGEPRLRP